MNHTWSKAKNGISALLHSASNKSTELFRIQKVALELPIVESGFVKNKSSQSIEKTTFSYSNERLQHDTGLPSVDLQMGYIIFQTGCD